jgi:hypothetical protein
MRRDSSAATDFYVAGIGKESVKFRDPATNGGIAVALHAVFFPHFSLRNC